MGRLLACIRIRMVIGSMSLGFPLVASPEELFRQRRRLGSERRRYFLHAPARRSRGRAHTSCESHHYHGQRY